MELNLEGLEMQKWNIPTDRAQRVDGKNEVICLVVMFNSGDMVIKMSICIFYWCLQKFGHSLGKILKYIERSYLFLSENAMDFWILSYH